MVAWSVIILFMSLRTLLVPAPLCAGELLLTGDEAHHARTVLRLQVKDQVRLADGAGRCAVADITHVGRHDLRLQVAAPEIINDGPAQLLSIAVAPPKGDRLSDLVRGLTELGVGAITLLETERSERLPNNIDRLQRIAGEALKQCRRAHLPRLALGATIPTLVQSGARLTVLDRSGRAAAPGTPASVTLVIGPEGGFTPAELTELTDGGAITVCLASPILRIETAAIAAAAVWSAAWLTDGCLSAARLPGRELSAEPLAHSESV